MRIGLGGLADMARRLWDVGQSSVANSFSRLSTGLRINKAMDDAAGLAISEGLTARINGFEQGARNAQDGLSLTQIAEGGLASMHDALQRMRTLAVQSSNGTYSAEDRGAMQAELNGLIRGIDDVVAGTEFNGQQLLDGSVAGRHIQVGAESGDDVTIDISRYDSVGLGLRDDGAALAEYVAPDPATMTTAASTTTTVAPVTTTTTTTTTADPTQRTNKNGKLLGGGKLFTPTATTTTTTTTTTAAPTTTGGWALSVLDEDSAHEALGVIDDAIWAVSHGRSDLGATQNRLERSMRSAGAAQDALTAARSRMRDTDMASEMSQLVRHQIAGQAAVAMMAQANMTSRRSMEALLTV